LASEKTTPDCLWDPWIGKRKVECHRDDMALANTAQGCTIGPRMKLAIATLLAAIVSFVWGYLSWMQMTWHQAGMHEFKDESAVTEVIKNNATGGRGIYMLPFPRQPLDMHSDEEKATMLETQQKAMEEGPYLYAIVRPGKQDTNMTQQLTRSFVRSLIASLIVGALMSHLVLSYLGRVAYAAAFGAFAGLAVDVQTWIWFELPTRDLIVNMADHFIEWSLAGLVLAAFLGKDPTVNDVH
jgi:hypothetical protein